jgi:hypothetical protein
MLGQLLAGERLASAVETLRRILENPEAMAAVERIEGWRSLGDNIIETIINRT